MGRASTYTQEMAESICALLCEGISLREICRNEAMPPIRTVFEWLAHNEDFRTKYARAREIQAEVLADEILDISDDGQNDWMERKSSDGENIGWMENGEALRRSELRIKTRQWVASKLLPKKYGEKVQTEITGANGGPVSMTLADFYGGIAAKPAADDAK